MSSERPPPQPYLCGPGPAPCTSSAASAPREGRGGEGGSAGRFYWCSAAGNRGNAGAELRTLLVALCVDAAVLFTQGFSLFPLGYGDDGDPTEKSAYCCRWGRRQGGSFYVTNCLSSSISAAPTSAGEQPSAFKQCLPLPPCPFPQILVQGGGVGGGGEALFVCFKSRLTLGFNTNMNLSSVVDITEASANWLTFNQPSFYT